MSQRPPTDVPPAKRLPDLDDDGITPEVREAFLRTVARVEKRRRIRLGGLVLSVVVLVFGLLGALYYMGLAPKQFRAWAMFIPLGLVGVILWLFGRWSRRS